MNEERAQYWAAIIEEQEKSGESIKGFCRERKVGEHSFYIWRARLRGRRRKGTKKAEPVRFALVERKNGPPVNEAAKNGEAAPGGLELQLPSGARLRIERGVDAATLGLVLEALKL